MKKRKTGVKITRKGASDGKASPVPSDKTNSKSTTMEIPTDAIFDDASVENITRLEVIIPGEPPSTIPLDRPEIMIGRGDDCRLCLPLNNVSWNHAKIVKTFEEFAIEDMNSTNGTFVNNVRVMRCTLHDNDQIRIGAAKIFFVRHKSRVRQ